jgi:2-methylcitrate dehydratase PrpD
MLAFHAASRSKTIGDAIFPSRQGRFHTTGTCGSFGSAAACAKLRGLSLAQTAYAPVAASQPAASGAPVDKAFHAGTPPKMDRRGGSAGAHFTGADDVLEAPLGFFRRRRGLIPPQS